MKDNKKEDWHVEEVSQQQKRLLKKIPTFKKGDYVLWEKHVKDNAILCLYSSVEKIINIPVPREDDIVSAEEMIKLAEEELQEDNILLSNHNAFLESKLVKLEADYEKLKKKVSK